MLYPHPFSRAYWKDAAAELRSTRKLTFAALMIALCMVLSFLPSPMLFQGTKLTWGFLGRSLCSFVCGPVVGVVFGCAEDLLSFFATGGDGSEPFFPGYTLTTMLGCFIYALCLYRANLTLKRVFLAKLLTNIENVALGTLWSAILTGRAYMVIAPARAVKNLIALPFQTLVLCLLFALLLPALKHYGLVPRETQEYL